MTRRRHRLLWAVVLLVPMLFFGLFFVHPLITIFDVSLRPKGELDLSGFTKIITSDYYRDTLTFTIFQALVSTLLTIALALPGAYVVTRYSFPGKQFLLSLSILPVVLPSVVVAAAFSALLGERGIVNTALMNVLSLTDPPIHLERSLTLILIVHVFYNYAVALRIIAGFWANQSWRIEEAARMLGCEGWRLWWEIRLPLLRPAILAAAVLIFIFSFTSFGTVLILGGLRFATVEVQIYYQAMNVFNLPLAAALSLVQMGLMFGLMWTYSSLQRRIPREWHSAQQVARPPHTPREKSIVLGTVVFMALFLLTPLLALVYRSLSIGGGLSFDYYMMLTQNPRQSILFVPPNYAIGNSLFFALITMIMATILGLILSVAIQRPGRFARFLDAFVMIPLATSAVTLGFGYLVALDEPPLALRSSWVILPIAHTLVAIPFVVRSVLPALRSIPPSVQDAAIVLGASTAQRWWRIDLPMISRGLAVGAAFGFTASMGEFGASLFLVRPDSPTIPTVIFRLLSQPGASNYGQALAMSVILMLVCGIGFLSVERLRSAGMGEF
jgi:thiamine transport system permease protein